MPLYFITGNAGKFAEVKQLIPAVEQLDVDLPELQEISAERIIEAKLNEARKHTRGQLLVEDTSLYLSCLNGLPGPLIKWFLKALGTNGLANLSIRMGQTAAQAKTLIGYAGEDDTVVFYEGVIDGTIVLPRGTNGFGWDAIFQPAGQMKTFAEMSPDEKNTYSMRKIAVLKLKEQLRSV